MTDNLVAVVVGIIYLASGRPVTDDIIDAWAIALEPFPDGDDVRLVAGQVARDSEHPTAATFAAALRAHRQRARPARLKALPAEAVHPEVAKKAMERMWRQLGLKGNPIKGVPAETAEDRYVGRPKRHRIVPNEDYFAAQESPPEPTPGPEEAA